jgi:hypothetical protein
MVIPEREGPWFNVHLAVFAIMHPTCAVRTHWDVYILLVMLALCLITPYTIGFDITPSNFSVLGTYPTSFRSSTGIKVLLCCLPVVVASSQNVKHGAAASSKGLLS